MTEVHAVDSSLKKVREKKAKERVMVHGHDVVDWVRKIVLPRIKRSPNNERYLFPDPIADFDSFSSAHSWYKHFRKSPGKFYPSLRVGTEKTGIVNVKEENERELKQTDPLHWAFIQDQALFQDVRDFQSGYHFSHQPWSMMKDCFFFVSDAYSGFNLAKDSNNIQWSDFHVRCMLKQCDLFRDRITRILLEIDPNPPSKVELLYDPTTDGVVESDFPDFIVTAQGDLKFEKEEDEDAEEDSVVLLSGKTYKRKRFPCEDYQVFPKKKRYSFSSDVFVALSDDFDVPAKEDDEKEDDKK